MDIDGDVEEAASRRVQVRFVTKLKPPFKAPLTSIAIPSNLTRLGLSAVVNNLLKAGINLFSMSVCICIIFHFLSYGHISNLLPADQYQEMKIGKLNRLIF